MQYSPDARPSEADGFVVNVSEKIKDPSRTSIARFGKTRTATSLKTEPAKDKELIHHGLQRLRSSFISTSRPPSRYTLHSNKRTQSKLTLPSETTSRPALRVVPSKLETTEIGTMTDLIQDEKPIDFDETVLSKGSSAYKDMQWTDPRLLRKYALVKAQQPYKKSMTIPIVEKSDVGNALLTETTDDEVEEVEKLEKKHVVIRTIVTVIGGLFGITLIAMMIWKLLENDLLMVVLGLRMKPPIEEHGLKSFIKYVGGFIIYVVNNTMKKVVHFLTLPTSEVFFGHSEESAWSLSFLNFLN